MTSESRDLRFEGFDGAVDWLRQCYDASRGDLSADTIEVDDEHVRDILDGIYALRQTVERLAADAQRHDCEAWAREGEGCAACHDVAATRAGNLHLLEVVETLHATCRSYEERIARYQARIRELEDTVTQLRVTGTDHTLDGDDDDTF